MSAKFRNGDPLMVDYTPGAGNVGADDIVLLGNTVGITCGVAHKAIVNNVEGHLAVGGGVYELTFAGNVAAWGQVYIDIANQVATNDVNNVHFGYAVEAGVNGTTGLVKHSPDVFATS